MNEYPFITGADNNIENELPLYVELSWDFENDCFIYDKYGNHEFVEGKEAIKIWIYKTLQVERFKYLAYSWQYGLELEKYIGKVMGVQERLSELKRCIIESLMVNPYIKAIQNMEFKSNSADEIECVFDCVTIYGEVGIVV